MKARIIEEMEPVRPSPLCSRLSSGTHFLEKEERARNDFTGTSNGVARSYNESDVGKGPPEM
eukprot:CAMPEP_0174897648 /NCGR_PEP_ID=MMETSP0167-20121228/15703_1 /TAXON_ID=38298 /ORGANISM="Rhodella maculata, Strain CCMP736" /LENGTH=61 /DNA_ID=CAMNT_0016137805 /DNA_START=56 /DNA_END=241 /DNA_ORIENTATION=+